MREDTLRRAEEVLAALDAEWASDGASYEQAGRDGTEAVWSVGLRDLYERARAVLLELVEGGTRDGAPPVTLTLGEYDPERDGWPAWWHWLAVGLVREVEGGRWEAVFPDPEMPNARVESREAAVEALARWVAALARSAR